MKRKLTKLELQILEPLWTRGPCSVREILDGFPKRKRPAFTTVQTTVYRLEGKKAVRIVKRVGNANILEAAISRTAAENQLIDDLLALLGGRVKPVIARLVESGKLTLDDIRELEIAAGEDVSHAQDRIKRKKLNNSGVQPIGETGSDDNTL